MKKKFYLSPVIDVIETDISELVEDDELEFFESTPVQFSTLFKVGLSFRLSWPLELEEDLSDDQMFELFTRVYNNIICDMAKSDEQYNYIAMSPRVNIIQTRGESGKFEYSYTVQNFKPFEGKIFVASEDPNSMGFEEKPYGVKTATSNNPYSEVPLKIDTEEKLIEEFGESLTEEEMKHFANTAMNLIVNNDTSPKMGKTQILHLDEDNEFVLQDLVGNLLNPIDECDHETPGYIISSISPAKGIIRGIDDKFILVELHDEHQFKDNDTICIKQSEFGYRQIKVTSVIVDAPSSVYKKFMGDSFNDFMSKYNLNEEFNHSYPQEKLIYNQRTGEIKDDTTRREKLEDGIYLTSPSDYNSETKTYNMTPFNPKEVVAGGNIQMYKVDDLNGFYAPFTTLVEMVDGVQPKGYFYVKKL